MLPYNTFSRKQILLITRFFPQTAFLKQNCNIILQYVTSRLNHSNILLDSSLSDPSAYNWCIHSLHFPELFFIDTGKEDEKENRDQIPLQDKRPIKTSRSKGKQHKAEKSSIQHDPGITSSSVENGRQEFQVADHGASEDMNLMQMTSVLKDLQSLSTALLTMDKESEDSQHSI